MKDYLVVYAHPNPKSFNHAILTAVGKRLGDLSKTYDVRELYALKFNPVLAGDDFAAIQSKKLPQDILTEQEYIRNAEALLFIYPIWWFGMPAILKGYIDRVFSYGFAYDVDPKEGLRGLLPEKDVVIINTTGGPEKNYKKIGFTDALKKTTDVGTFGLCGMKVVMHKYFYGVTTVSLEVRKAMLEEIGEMKL